MSSIMPETATAHVSLATERHQIDGVGIWNLHVMVTRDGDLWIAQGLEIDHVAQGSSSAEVKQLFQEGFLATINEHLKRFNSIEGMLVGAPREVLLEFDDLALRPLLYTHVSLHVEPINTPARIHYFALPEAA